MQITNPPTLADALKLVRSCIKGYTNIGCVNAMSVIEQALAANEAAKAATGDDTDKLFDQWFYTARDPEEELPYGTHLIYRVCDKDADKFNIGCDLLKAAFVGGINAALRQGVTLPREVVDALEWYGADTDSETEKFQVVDKHGGFIVSLKTFGERARNALSLLDQHARGG